MPDKAVPPASLGRNTKGEPDFFFRVPEKTAGHQRVAFPIDS
jgi:hypothetical protein